MMNTSNLFTSYQLDEILLKNRIVMAPMTRSRATDEGIPTDLMTEYYSQRVSAGLIITEATQISKQGQGYANTPGIYTEEQIKHWKNVTDKVHEKGGQIFMQLWHVGRVGSHLISGTKLLAPSPIKAKNTNVYIFEGDNRDATFIDVDIPKEMNSNDIQTVIKEYQQAAKNAIIAGFDGVEIHGANGYLIDQFLRSNSNKRKDNYGGNVENRARFLLEVVEGVVKEIGATRVGVRLSPFIKMKDMDDPEILDTILYGVEELNKLKVTYLHLCEADWDDAPEIPESFRIRLREIFSNTIIATGNMTDEEAEMLLGLKWIDLAGFGRNFISNPDFPIRLKKGVELQPIIDTHTLFGGRDEIGYTDYPFLTV